MTVKELEVRKHLSRFVIPIEALSVASITAVLWEKPPGATGIALLFMLPVAFGLHVTEEFIWPGGFISWDNVFRPQFADTAGLFYVKVNIFPTAAAFLLALGALANPTQYLGTVVPSWLTICTFMSWNAMFHLRGAIRTGRYSPGMMTGVMLFGPLTIASYVYFLRVGLPPLLAVLAGAMAFVIQPILDRMKRNRRKAA